MKKLEEIMKHNQQQERLRGLFRNELAQRQRQAESIAERTTKEVRHG